MHVFYGTSELIISYALCVYYVLCSCVIGLQSHGECFVMSYCTDFCLRSCFHTSSYTSSSGQSLLGTLFGAACPVL